MRKALTIALLLLASAGAVSYAYYAYWKARQTESRHETLAVQSFALPNGLAVELVTGECGDSVALVVSFAVGANHDPPGQSGMTHLVERMLSASMHAGQAKRTVQSGSDHILFAVVTTSAQLFGELDAIASCMSRIEFGEPDFQSARKQVLEEVAKRSGGDASLTAVTYAAESIQPSRGNGRRGGVAAEIQAIDRAQVTAFWRAHLAPANARIVVVGRMERDKVRARIEKTFGALPAGTHPALRPPGESTVVGTLVMGDAPKSVAMAVPAPLPTEKIFPAFLVLAARLMGEPSGSHGWAASYDPLTLPETLFVTGAVQSGEAAEPAARRIVADATQVVARPLTPADVSAASKRFGLFLGISLFDPSTCTSDPRGLAIARARRGQLGLEKVQRAQTLAATTQRELSEAAELFGPRRATTVIAGGVIR